MKIFIDGQTLNTPEINRGIGRYFINCIEGMLECTFSDEFFISLADKNDLKIFSSFAQSKLQPAINKDYHPAKSSHEKYTETLNTDLINNKIDLYWNPNPLMVNVFLPERHCETKFSATIYDLIPLIMKDIYMKNWPIEISNYYLKKLKIFQKDYSLFLHISNNTKKDFLKNVKVSLATNEVTHLAVGEQFVPDPFPKTSRIDKYILYTGGIDPRKNMHNAIKAYAALQTKYKDNSDISDTKLHIVCAVDENSKKELINLTKSLNVDNKVVITGFISEQDLVLKYQKAKAFFFPSIYEGFGLPIVEALSCGLSVACANTSSLPEIGKSEVHYFNPDDINDMVKAIYSALNDPFDYKSRLRRHYFAQQFNWDKTVQKTISAFHMLLVKNIKIPASNKKELIAWLSPMPPLQTGIANYSYSILQELKNKANIHLYYDGLKPIESSLKQLQAFPISEFKKNYKKYHKVYYNIGNNSLYHQNIYKLAWHLPGIVILHDFNLRSFLEDSFLKTDEKSYFHDSLTEGYNLSHQNMLQKIENGEDGYIKQYPMSHALVKRSKETIVHSLWVKNQFDKNQNITIIPHFAVVNYHPTKAKITDFYKKYNISKNEYIISIIGFINKNKLPQLTQEVINKLNDLGYPIKLVFAGELASDLTFLRYIKRNKNYSKNTIFTNYLEEKDYFTTLFASDIIINLRNPTMGESSGTLMQSLAANKITIVSNLNQYKEFPDTVCPKINHDGKTETQQLISIIRKILGDPELREKYQETIRKYVKSFSIAEIAKKYL